MTKKLLLGKDVAAMLGLSQSYFSVLVYRHKLDIPYINLPGSPRRYYREEDVESWLENKVIREENVR